MLDSFERSSTCIIAALLLPLSWLSQPATTESDGGILAQVREENHLSQADLGEIDPTSETIKLATLGMRGVAANILWEKANEYKREEDWTNLSATLEQIDQACSPISSPSGPIKAGTSPTTSRSSSTTTATATAG